MNNTDIQVVVGPANYYSHPGALLRLDDFYHQEQLSRAVWIYGERAIAATHPFLPESFSLPGARHLPFGGHCTDPDLIALAQAAGEDRQVVIGVGGGALLDTAKALARRLDVPCVAIPTIAATCAAWTPLSVWYNSAGQASHYEVFNDANHLVLVEPEIVLRAPVEYLLAGIGDTLAKWYEAVVLAPEPDVLPLTVRLGIDTAATLRDVLINQSAAALEDQRNGVLSQNFRDVIDAIIAGGGMVGGLGERYTRIAAAHAVHNGLTILPQTVRYLHGTKVAYGILVQCVLLSQIDTARQLIAAYQQFNLPTTLAALGVDINNHTEIDQVIAHTLRPAESIHALPVPVTAESLRAAFITVEALGQ
ncbi:MULTISPECIES: oxidoreductase [unclassified Erwinia]|uniref:oxidoreductase n=1 Tax=unclassified Erwinia TaxID=2622719 RepID=UPI0014877691|nr:oxidoreductase [Erwinia sp. JH02]NNS09798.1 oxidoreductase [Erwinia sp. JH02]